MKQRYTHIKYFQKELLKAKARYEEFEVIKTTYSRKIKKERESIIFNKEGNTDDKDLMLISMVRNDAKKFNANNNVLNKKIEKTNFFDLLDVINSKEVIKKVDLKSAYWELALKETIISENTNEKFKSLFDGYDNSSAKQSRLRALGSLATVKHHQFYLGDRLIQEKIKKEVTRDLYLHVCAGVDKLMREVHENVKGCKYYYWDCVFVSGDHENEAIEFLRSKGYHTSSQETRLEFMKIGGVGYLISTSDDKIYMTRKENSHLLDFGNKERDDYMIDDWI